MPTACVIGHQRHAAGCAIGANATPPRVCPADRAAQAHMTKPWHHADRHTVIAKMKPLRASEVRNENEPRLAVPSCHGMMIHNTL